MIEKLMMKRVARRDGGAFSVLLDMEELDPITKDPFPFALTLERTYARQTIALDDGYRMKILPGRYECFRGRYHRGQYDTFEIVVPGHQEIKFHKGNWETDLDGCPAVGESYEVMKAREAIGGSSAGFDEMMRRCAHLSRFWLVVANV